MKKDKAVSFLWSWLLSFFLSLSAVMWLVSAFRLGVDKSLLTVFCAIFSFVCSLCYSLPLGAVPVGISALALGYLWRKGTLELSVEALLNRLTRQYNKAYNWGIIRWGLRTADEMEPTMITVLCILAALVAMTTAWAVCRRKSSVWPMLSIWFVCCCFVVNDTVPDTVWIYILLVCLASLLLTGPVRRQDAARANRLYLLTVPVSVLGLLLLLWAAPREGYDRQQTAQKLADGILGADSTQLIMSGVENLGAATGITDPDRVDLSSVGYRTESEATVMTVSATFNGTLYLRGRAMNTYDGTGWTNEDMGDLPWPEEGLVNAGELTVSTRFAHRMMYLPYYTNYAGFTDVSAGVENEKNLTQYSFLCQKLPKRLTPETVAMSTSVYLPPDSMESAIQLDPEVKKWAEPLALKITDGADTFAKKAERIASYVRNSAKYSLYTARMPDKEEDFARWFLEKSDTGYCVHFATATTVLLQAAGIPARYVTGYLVEVKEGEAVPVQSKQSHAWAEYYLPNFGWVVLEATPSASVPVPGTTPEQTEPEATQSTLPETENTAPSVPENEETPAPEAPEKSVWPTVLVWTAVLAAVAACLLQSRIRVMLHKKKIKQALPNEKALLYWQETVELAKLLDAAPDQKLLHLAERAKFSRHILTEEELSQFEYHLKEAIAQLKKRNLFLQIYYRLLLAKY